MIKDYKTGNYIRRLRAERGITLKQLSDGLCTESFLNRLETGKREVDKLLLDRLLERLGVATESHENFLFYDDYNRWYDRQLILQSFNREQISKAREYLSCYQSKYNMEYSLDLQFILSVNAYILRYEGYNDEAVGAVFSRALCLTVNNPELQPSAASVLSYKELDLLLEHLRHNKIPNRTERYKKLLDYITDSGFDSVTLAKIYPKAVYYMYMSMTASHSLTCPEIGKLTRLCENATNILSNANRTFYINELLDMKKALITMIEENCTKVNRGFPTRLKKRLYDYGCDSKMWKLLYDRYGIRAEMFDCSYLYADYEIYCIEDVIRTRRKMLGMTMAKLADNICGIRTVSRLEQKKMRTQREIVRQLFFRLNLPPELHKDEILTSNPELLRKFIELQDASRNRRYDDAEKLLSWIENHLENTDYQNHQVLSRYKSLIMYFRHMLTPDDYVKLAKNALEYTIPYDIATGDKEKYLTMEEISCLCNILSFSENNSSDSQKCMNSLIRLYDNDLLIEAHAAISTWVMRIVGSKLGNQGDYNRSDAICENLLSLGLRLYRPNSVYENLYGLLWNDEQRKKAGLEKRRKSNVKEELMYCFRIASFVNDRPTAEFLQDKLDNGF